MRTARSNHEGTGCHRRFRSRSTTPIEFTSDPTIAPISVLLIVLTTGAVLLVERLVGFTRFV